MPRVALTVQDVSRTTPLANPTQNTPDLTDGNSFVNNGRTILYLTNNNASSRTLTIPFPTTVDGLAVASRTVTLTTGQRQVIGPFPSSYNTDGKVYLDWDAVTDVTVEVLSIPTS